jgi:hypothetical protein
LNSLWMFSKLQQKSVANMQNSKRVRNTFQELNKYRDSLFINTGTSFSYGDFYSWDCPANYPAKNLVYGELIHTNNYQPIFQRYRINDLVQELPVTSMVFLIGDPLPLLKEYYTYRKGWKVSIKRVPHFSDLNVYQIKLSSSH